jgi:hypothetical protein
LRDDLAQTRGLAAQNPERCEQMRQTLEKIVGADGKQLKNPQQGISDDPPESRTKPRGQKPAPTMKP